MKNLWKFHLKKSCYFLLLIYFFGGNISSISAQWHYNFESKTFGGGNTTYSVLNKVIEKSNGNLLINGTIYFDSTYPLIFRGKYDVWLVEVDANINKVNENVLGSSNTENGYSLISQIDSGYLIAFNSMGNDSDLTCFYAKNDGTVRISTHLFKYNKYDSLIWKRCYGDTINSSLLYGDGIRESSRNEIMLSMGGYTGCSTNYFPRIKMLDNLGNLKWLICGSHLNGLGLSRCTAEDAFGNYYMGTDAGAPYYYFPTVTSYINDVGLVKMDTNGVITQASVYGGNGIDKIHKILPQGNGDLILVLSSSSTSKHSGEPLPTSNVGLIWIIRVDSSGTVLQEEFFSGNAAVIIQDAIQLRNGNIMIASYSKSTYFMNQDSTMHHLNTLSGTHDVLLFEIDSNLNYIGVKSFGGTGEERPNAIMQDSRDAIWIGGSTNSNDGDVDTIFNTFSNGWIIKLTEDSILGSKPSLLASKQDVSMYPNPAQESVRLAFNSNELPQQISLQDVQGNVLQSLNQIQKNQSLSIAHLANGLYLIRFSYANGQVLHKKLVVLR